MVLCEDDERRLGRFLLWEDVVGGGCGRGKSFIFGSEGCGSWFLGIGRDSGRDLLDPQAGQLIGCSSDEIVQEQLLTSELDGAVSARFRAVLNF